MTAAKEDVVAALRAAQTELDRIASSAPESAWGNEAYERWNAKQLLSHIASTSNVVGFLMAMARNPGASFSGEMDNDTVNAQQVALRESKTIAGIVAEARGYLEGDAERVSSASDKLLASHYRAPWGYEGPLAEVMRDSLRDHLMMHLRDLAKAVGG